LSTDISRTAVYVAAGRAIGAREPDPTVRNPDDLAAKLLGDVTRLAFDHPIVNALARSYEEAMEDPEVVSNVRMMIVRTRFIDEALERAVIQGAEQLLILGAGFDSHAWRCRELLKAVRVFEADRPAMQAYKRIYQANVLAQWEERNRCPANDQLCNEAVWFTQPMLLGPRKDMDDIVAAIRKIHAYAGELAGKA
jgi:methyltransferase (TIGR00027 family)